LNAHITKRDLKATTPEITKDIKGRQITKIAPPFLQKKKISWLRRIVNYITIPTFNFQARRKHRTVYGIYLLLLRKGVGKIYRPSPRLSKMLTDERV
jgi:hypothetical protein